MMTSSDVLRSDTSVNKPAVSAAASLVVPVSSGQTFDPHMAPMYMNTHRIVLAYADNLASCIGKIQTCSSLHSGSKSSMAGIDRPSCACMSHMGLALWQTSRQL